jgi:cysteinyl-tRNA synthetase
VQADADLIAFATLASSRLESSKATLSLVVNPATAPLTAEEKSRLADATLVAAAATAMPAEKTRDDARAALSAKQAVLDDAILQARNTDIDVDLTTVQAVTDATKDRDDAQKDFDKAVTDFTPAMQDDLHRWESALPQANWDLVHQLEEAKATLNELQAASLVAMTGAIATAEKAWVADLFARDKADRTSDWIAALVKSRASALEFETNANRQRRFTALRGDL